MTAFYSSGKSLYWGFGLAMTSFAIFAALIFNAEKLSQGMSLTALITSGVLAWGAVFFLHRGMYSRY